MLDVDMIINLTYILYYFKWFNLYMEIIWSLFYSLRFGASWRWRLYININININVYIYIYILQGFHTDVRSGNTYLTHSTLLSNVALCYIDICWNSFEKEKFFINSKWYWGKCRRRIILHCSYIEADDKNICQNI